jgi:hypothetical protein
MQEHLFRLTRTAGSALLISVLPAALAGQVRPVVSNQLAISQTEAALHLEFADNGTLEIALRDGSIVIDGDERGSFVRGDALDTAWRGLLAEIVSLSDGPLGEALRDWEAPSSLEDGALELAQLLDLTLEDALESDNISASAEPEVVVDATAPGVGLNVQELEDLADRLRLEIEQEFRGEIEQELRSEIEEELREEFGGAVELSRGYRPFRALGRGIAEVAGDLIAFLVLSLLALGAVYFASDNLEIVASEAQRNPMRAGMVGLAGAFLVLPTWVLGCVALVASLVGIVALPFWALLFPVAVALGAGLGYLAVARNLGEWVASKNISGLEWLRPTNTFYAITAGIGALLAFFVSASILDILPFFGFFSGLLATLGTMATVATVLIGFGAVLLTRGGRRADFYVDDDPFGGATWSDESTSEEVPDGEEPPDESTTTGSTTGGQDDV